MARTRATSIRQRTIDRALAPVRERYEREVQLLIEAGHRAMPRNGYDGTTLSEILSEAGMSTRAFYRHFRSKEELLLAMYERDADLTIKRLNAALTGTKTAREAFELWVDEQLSLMFAPRRSARSALFLRESPRLALAFPQEIARIHARIREPITQMLLRGREDGSFPNADPEPDSRSMQAVIWSIAAPQVHGIRPITREEARHHILRFCLPALGAQA